MTHQGLRFRLLWLLLGMVCALSLTRIKLQLAIIA
jgi:hypothetical protein